MADRRSRCGRNCRRGTGREHRPDRINRWTEHNWNFAGNCNRNVTGHDHAGLNPDPRNDATWNCKSDSGNGKSDTGNGSACAGHNSGDSSDQPDTGNESGSINSRNQPDDADSGDHTGNDGSRNCASCR